MNEVRAYAKNIKGSPRKARIVADAVRGKNAVYAIEALKYMPKGAALKIRKVVESAVANAVHNYNMDADTLVITKISVDPGFTLKRMHAQSRGRGRAIIKRTSNITVFVGRPGANKAANAKVEAKPAAADAEVKAVETKAEPKAKKETKTTKSTAKKAAPKAKKPAVKKDTK